MWNIIVLRQLFNSETTHQQKCSPQWPWSCWRRDQAGWGSSVEEAPHWAPRSKSSGPRSSGAGPWWGGSVSPWVTWANHFVVSKDASTMFRGGSPGNLGPIRVRQRNPFKRILTNSAVWSTRPYIAFSRTQNGSCQNQIGCRKTLQQNLMFLHSLLFCPFQTFGDRITG